jgi:2-methylcitrate dehydratase PrpD
MSDARPALTEQIARYVAETKPATVPEEGLDVALRAFIDTMGVTIAGRREEGFVALRRATRDELAPGDSTVLATGERTSPAHAALLNGMAGHALDYDDVAHPIYGHPSIALFPALLAVAERERASGRRLLEAYVIGYEVACAIADGLPIRPHYSKGWHSTATVGVLAATAGVCRLLGLPTDTVRHGLGIAASMASGSRQNFGTMTKPLHPGLSGWSAVTAARLAQSGYTADTSQLEADMGYFAMYGSEGDLTAVGRRLEGPWALLEDGLNVKKYPCCYNTHRTADAVLALAPRLEGRTEEIKAIRLTLEPGGFDPLIHHRPGSGLEGKFSAEYVIAAGLLDEAVGFDSFTDAAVRRPAAQQLIAKVDFAESEAPPFGTPTWDYAYAAVEVELDGTLLRERVDVPRGDARRPLTQEELDVKFRDCVAYSGADWDGQGLLAEVKELPGVERLDGFKHLVNYGTQPWGG